MLPTLTCVEVFYGQNGLASWTQRVAWGMELQIIAEIKRLDKKS